MKLASIVLAAAVTAATAGCAVSSTPPPEPSRVAAPCHTKVTMAAPPKWALAGFNTAKPKTRHILGAHGHLVAFLFSYPFVASTDTHKVNKILWVSHVSQQPMSPLDIVATLDGTRLVVHRQVAGGPGPSGVNLPRAGCWQLQLHWSGHTDAMTLAAT